MQISFITTFQFSLFQVILKSLGFLLISQIGVLSWGNQVIPSGRNTNTKNGEFTECSVPFGFLERFNLCRYQRYIPKEQLLFSRAKPLQHLSYDTFTA